MKTNCCLKRCSRSTSRPLLSSPRHPLSPSPQRHPLIRRVWTAMCAFNLWNASCSTTRTLWSASTRPPHTTLPRTGIKSMSATPTLVTKSFRTATAFARILILLGSSIHTLKVPILRSVSQATCTNGRAFRRNRLVWDRCLQCLAPEDPGELLSSLTETNHKTWRWPWIKTIHIIWVMEIMSVSLITIAYPICQTLPSDKNLYKKTVTMSGTRLLSQLKILPRTWTL